MHPQIPLIFTACPPRAVQLPLGFTPVRPLQQTQITRENLSAWIQECENTKEKLLSYGQEEKVEYEQWLEQSKKVAPGYSGTTLLLPRRTTENFKDMDI